MRPLGSEKLNFLRKEDLQAELQLESLRDNYLDNGYHVPHIHKGLNDVLEYKEYTIENGDQVVAAIEPDDGARRWLG
jgi:hypothetical protein